jgi:hypothetical protein
VIQNDQRQCRPILSDHPLAVQQHHGVSAKHLPRYLREWSYRFNRRNLPDGLDRYLIRRAVECATITYDQLKAGGIPIINVVQIETAELGQGSQNVPP